MIHVSTTKHHQNIVFLMGNLHYRLNLNPGNIKASFTTARKSMTLLKLKKCPSLVAKWLRMRKIQPCEVCEFVYKCITHGKAYHFPGKIDTRMVGFHVRNTFNIQRKLWIVLLVPKSFVGF